MDNKFLKLLQSRKFWAAVVALLFVFLGGRAGIDQEQLVLAVGTLIAYVLGVGLEDSKSDAPGG